jgi:hypothetical protein
VGALGVGPFRSDGLINDCSRQSGEDQCGDPSSARH